VNYAGKKRLKNVKIEWRQQHDLERYLFNDRAFEDYKFILHREITGGHYEKT
jgi:hypothetical protein